MQKISGILPSNSRITSVDREGEQPLRSGHEAGFGRSISKTEVVSRGAPKLTIIEAPKMHKQMSSRKMREIAHTEIVKKMSDGFFGKTNQAAPEVVPTPAPVTSLQSTSAPVVEKNYVANYVNPEDYGEFTKMVESSIEKEAGFATVGANLAVIG